MTALSVLVALGAEPSEPAVVHVVGEVDAATASMLTDALRKAMDGTAGPVVIDCARWTFVDAAGMRVLVWFAGEAATRERLAALRNLRPWMLHLLHVTGVDAAFPAGMAGFRA